LKYARASRYDQLSHSEGNFQLKFSELILNIHLPKKISLALFSIQAFEVYEVLFGYVLFFAKLSAISFPPIPIWLGIHID
jgi:hypothetical protein